MHLTLKTGHYKNNHDERDYYITFETGTYFQRSIDKDGTERKYKVHEADVLKSMLFSGMYLVKEIKTEEVNVNKNYSKYSEIEKPAPKKQSNKKPSKKQIAETERAKTQSSLF